MLNKNHPPEVYSLEGKRVWIAGHRGMVGSALVRRLETENCTLLTVDRRELDLRRQEQVEAWVREHQPHAVFLSAARVGGILANSTYPADFIYDNLLIEANIIHSAFAMGVERLLFLGSSCIYPKHSPQPISEEHLLTGSLEPTNEWYAIAKIAGVKLCQAYRKQHGCDFISAMPTNLYGPGDNFDPDSSHVAPALLRKAFEAEQSGSQTMSVWGSGRPKREFMHVDDAADALVHVMKHFNEGDPINIGCGVDISISELAQLVASVTGFSGDIVFDASKPDGAPRKLLNTNKLKNLGWEPKIPLEDGLRHTYYWFLERHDFGTGEASLTLARH